MYNFELNTSSIDETIVNDLLKIVHTTFDSICGKELLKHLHELHVDGAVNPPNQVILSQFGNDLGNYFSFMAGKAMVVKQLEEAINKFKAIPEK